MTRAPLTTFGAIVTLAVAMPSFADRLIGDNLDFSERSSVDDSKPAAWRPMGDGPELALDAADAPGKHSVRLWKKEGATFAAINQAFPAGAVLGKRLRLRGRLRTENVANGFAGLWLRIDGEKGPIAFDNMGDRGVTGTTGWTSYEVPLYVSPLARSIVYGALVTGTGTAWVADLSFSEDPAPVGQASLEARRYTAEVLCLMKTYSLRRALVDWPILEATVADISAGATTTGDTYPAIEAAIGMLGDEHSFFMEPRATSDLHDESAVEKEEAELETHGMAPRGEMLPDGIAYVFMPPYSGMNGRANQRFAQKIASVLETLDRAQPCAFVLDLRENSGGNMWPMLAGIGPLLGEGPCGSFVDPDGEAQYWSYEDGASRTDGESSVTLDPKVALRQPMPPVAVLQSGMTASSGEAVAVAFRGRPATRSFGEPTAGLSTANDTILLPDGAMMGLTVSTFADRDGTTYGGPLPPDVELPNPANGTPLADDPVVRAASEWLRSLSACRR